MSIAVHILKFLCDTYIRTHFIPLSNLHIPVFKKLKNDENVYDFIELYSLSVQNILCLEIWM